MAFGITGLLAQTSATPLIHPEWHQTAPWNRFCPGQGQNRAHAGSHALAMAKTMKYWAYPSRGVGQVSYVDDNFGTLTQNFDAGIDWGGMSNTQVFATTQRFIASSGIAVYTDYAYDYSTSSLLNVKNALVNNFIYDEAMQIVSRADYGSTAWQNIIRFELDNRRPVIYSISTTEGVELAFILDAYDDLGRFHANFSAENMPNDWLLLDNLIYLGEPVLPAQQTMLYGIQPSLGPETISENFEDGFGYYNWQFAGNTGWTISTESAYFGSHSAKSGNIDHNQSSSMFITIDVSEASVISFYKRVSCESEPNHLYDHLRFEIDGVEQDRWSGDGSWAFHEYPVSPGVHTFRWTYAKDGASTYFNDCAWVDAITFPPGTTPLMPPRFVQASLSGQRNVALSWTQPLVTDGLMGYKIFRNGGEIAQFYNPQLASFTDYDLPNGDYTYHLQAVYAAGLSIPSNSSIVSVEVPYAPINLSAEPASYSSIQLAWQAPPLLRDRALLGYKVFRDDQLIATLDSPTLLSYHDMGLSTGVYYYQVSALYTGAESARSNTAMGVLGVAQPPANLQALVSGNDVQLSWNQVLITDNLLGFKVFRNNLQIAHLQNPDQLSYLDENLANGTYSYYVRAVYEEVESGNSATVIANVEVPYPPTNLIAIMIVNDVQLHWQRPPLSRALTHYYIYRDGQVIGAVFNPNNTSYTDHDLAPGIYTYYVTAFYSGVESAPSNIASTGSEPLWPPHDLNYTLVDNDVELSWQPPVIYDRDLTGYRVWRNESVIADNHPTNIYLDANLPNGTYQYKVAAIYTDGISEPTPTIMVIVAYALPPTNLQLSLNGPEVQLSWQAPASGPSPDSYRVYRNSVMLAEASQPVYTDLISQTGSYTYYVTALYGGVESTPSNSVTEFVNLAPQTPVLSGQTLGNTVVLNIDRGFVPEGYEFAFTSIFRNGEPLINFVENDFYIDNDIPNGVYEYTCYSVYGFEHPHVTQMSDPYNTTIDLVYAPSNLSGTQDGSTISLSWDGVYSPLRPITYRVYRNGAVVAQTAGTSFTDMDLPGGNYSYYVTALFGSQESGATNGVTFYVEELLPPTNLTGSVQERDAHLSWTAPEFPDRAFLGYRVWRNSTVIEEQTSAESYIDANLPNGSYQYRVAAIYSSGISDLTAPLTLTISYTPAPQNLSASVTALRVVNLAWSAPDDVDADYYNVYRDSAFLAQASWEAAEDIPTASGSYSYYVTAVYGELESEPSNTVTMEVNLNPTTLQLFGALQDNDITLNWSVEQEPPLGELLRYEIYRNSGMIAESMTQTFTDSDLPNGSYTYSVRAVYSWYGTYITDFSNAFSGTIDMVYPPQGLQYSLSGNNVQLNWEAVFSALSPVSYKVYRNGVALAQTTTADYLDAGLANGAYNYHVTALFGEAESAPSNTVNLFVEILYPATNLSAEVEEDTVTLAWDIPATGPTRALTGYFVYRNGSLHQALANPSQSTFTDTGVPNGNYSYYVIAVYGSGVSAPSNTVSIVVNVVPELLPPTNLSATISGERDILLSWDAPQPNPTGYLIYRNGAQIGTSSGTEFPDPDLPNGVYEYYVRAQYPLGISSASNSVQINLMYAYPPQALTAEVVNQNDISLNWSAPGQGEIGYLIFVNNSELLYLSNPQTTSYLIEAQPNGEYSIFVKAVYQEAVSQPGNTATVSIGIPHSPLGFALEVSQNNVQLSWDAPGNLYGFSHYQIYRDGTALQISSYPAYTDATLPNGQYQYQISAVYAFGESALSPALPALIQITYAPSALQASVDGNDVLLSWESVSDIGFLSAYKIYRDGALLQTVTNTFYTDQNLPNGQYLYHVVASYSFADSEPTNSVMAQIEVPYPPANLSATVQEDTVTLAWEAPPTFSRDLLGYKIFRDGEFLQESTLTSYSDGELDNGSYSYEVRALYTNAESIPGATVNVTVTVAYPPTNLAFNYLPPNGVSLSWSPPQAGETGFNLYRNDALIAQLAADVQTYIDSNLPNGDYTYKVSASYGEINSAFSNEATAHILRVYAPQNLTLTQNAGDFQFSWYIADATFLIRYEIYDNGVLMANTINPYYSRPTPPNGLHSYYVLAIYEGELQSAPSNTVHVNVQIAYPTTLSGNSGSNSVLLYWTPITDTGGFLGYYLYCDGLIVYNGSGTNFHHQNIPNGVHNYHVKVRYQWGDSEPSNTYTAAIWLPYPPTDLISTVSGNNVQLSWNATQDATQLLGYRIKRDGVQIAQVTETGYLDEDLPNGDYSYEIRAIYEFGTSSPIMDDVQVQYAHPPLNLDYYTDQNTVGLSWDNPTDTAYFQYFRVYRDDVLIETTTINAFTDPSLPNAAYEYTVTAVYEFGESEPSPTLLILIQIAYPPQNLKANLTEENAILNWVAPVDSGFLQHYNVYRNDELIGQTEATVFSDTNLFPGTYDYWIKAAYTFGESDASNSAQVQFMNLVVPQNLQATSVESSVQLSWNNVPTAVHFLRYNVYRDEEVIGSSTVNSFVDEDLPNGSYSYQVSAVYTQGESQLSQSTDIDHLMPYPPQQMFIEIQRNIAMVSWYTPVDTGFLTGFRIYRNGAAIHDMLYHQPERTLYTFADTNLEPGLYSYAVASIYGDVLSPQVTPVNPEDETIQIDWPHTPQNLSAVTLGNAIQLRWDTVPTDPEFLHYNVYMNELMTGNTVASSYSLTALANGIYSFRVTAQYQDIESALSEPASTEFILPRLPENFSATLVDGYRVRLTWQIPQDSYGFAAYILKRQGTQIYTGTETTFLDEHLPNGNYTYSLQSVYGEDLSAQVVVDIRIAQVAGATSVVATNAEEGYQISFNAPDMLFAPDYYEVYFIPNYPNSPIADWVFVESKATPGTVLDTVHGGLEHGSFTWAVVCGWHGIYETGTTYSNSILVPKTPEYNYLVGNHPNPFNPSTNIAFWLKEDTSVKLKVYNSRGQLVRSLFSGDLPKGTHTVVFDGKDDAGRTLNSGLYIYRMESKGYSRTRKMMLSK
jgi:hypothetical protein